MRYGISNGACTGEADVVDLGHINNRREIDNFEAKSMAGGYVTLTRTSEQNSTLRERIGSNPLATSI